VTVSFAEIVNDATVSFAEAGIKLPAISTVYRIRESHSSSGSGEEAPIYGKHSVIKLIAQIWLTNPGSDFDDSGSIRCCQAPKRTVAVKWGARTGEASVPRRVALQCQSDTAIEEKITSLRGAEATVEYIGRQRIVFADV
jgi:hypothetical protein